ncbi:MAG: hypothetical protein KatS3mg110_3877 [Pirellulaceae bacterium]|nr:MAG: hypothetical protein KatS3mg110_3877 [Pirellulaceae bacterium]
MIKAAISREREYLADAAAVQFTRFPDGIAGALKKIGGLLIGSQMMHPAAEEASHMYFSMGFRTHVAGLFATHPPLVKRIRRIDPSFKGVFPKVKLLPEFAEQAPSLRQKPPERHVPSFADEQRDRLRLSASVALAAVGNVSQQAAVYINQIIEQMPARLRQAAREPWEARCVLFALLWDQDARVASRQEQILLRREDEATLRLTNELRGEVQRLPDAARLPLVQLVQATLRHISKEQYAQFRGTVKELVAADERITLREFVLQHLVLTHLDRHFFKAAPEPVQYHSVQALQSEIALLLSFITHIGKPAPAAAQQAFQMGLVASGINKSLELVPWRECRLRKLEEALAKLRAAAPAVKKRILNGMFTVAGCDQVISTDEAELLRAIAEAIDCPMPPLVASHVAAEHA